MAGASLPPGLCNSKIARESSLDGWPARSMDSIGRAAIALFGSIESCGRRGVPAPYLHIHTMRRAECVVLAPAILAARAAPKLPNPLFRQPSYLDVLAEVPQPED